MKTFFADYLVQKGLLKEEELVLALLEQCKSMPSIVEIAYEKGLLSSKDIIRVFKVQTLKKMEFAEAAKDLGLWSNDLDVKIQEHYNSTKEPLIEILHRKKAISLEAVTAALDEYLVECAVAPAQQKAESAPVAKVEAEQARPAVQPEFTVSMQEFANQFNEAARKSILDTCLGVSSEPETGPEGVERALNKFRTLSELVHRLLGVSKFAQLTLSEKSLENIEEILQVVLQSKKPHDMNNLKDINKIISESADALWSLRNEYLIKGSQEAEAMLGEAEREKLSKMSVKRDEVILLYS